MGTSKQSLAFKINHLLALSNIIGFQYVHYVLVLLILVHFQCFSCLCYNTTQITGNCRVDMSGLYMVPHVPLVSALILAFHTKPDPD